MTNIVNVKIDLDDPNTWINAEVMLRNLSVTNDAVRRAGIVLNTEQINKIIQINNDKLPSIPLEDITSIPTTEPNPKGLSF